MVTYNGGAVNFPSTNWLDEEVDKCRDERDAVAEHYIFPLQCLQLVCVVFPKEGEVDIQSHGERPECVCRHEPIAIIVSRSFHTIGVLEALHLDEKSLKLAQWCSVSGRWARGRDECSDIGHDIAPAGVENESVDRLMESFIEYKGRDDEGSSEE